MIIGFRDRIRDMSPAILKDGVGEREMYCFGLGLDAITEKRVQAIAAREPPYAQPDALAVIAHDRLIAPGLTESTESLAARTQRAFATWQTAGMARSVLTQCLGRLLSKTPMVRFVSTRYDKADSPATRMSSQWDTYPEGRDPRAEPVHVDALVINDDGDFEWDDSTPVDESFAWWAGYIVFYSVGVQAWCGPAALWGAGATFTGAGSGLYSVIASGQRTGAGSYAGTPVAWGAGATFTGAGSGLYSVIASGQRTGAGSYAGAATGWGVDVGADVMQSLLAIAALWKPADVWIRWAIVSFDAGLFDPAWPNDGTHNPAGDHGRWSKIVAGQRVAARFADAVYAAGVA